MQCYIHTLVQKKWSCHSLYFCFKAESNGDSWLWIVDMISHCFTSLFFYDVVVNTQQWEHNVITVIGSISNEKDQL